MSEDRGMDGGARLRVTLLGDLRVYRGDAALSVPGARSQRLLVRLALAAGRVVERGVLVAAVWDEPPSGAGHALQALVSRLRRTLGPTADIARIGEGYRLAVDPDDVDALRFERLAAEGRDRLRSGAPDAAASMLREAMALWGERPGAEPTVVAAVAPATATRLAGTAVEAAADLAETELAVGRADAATARLTALLAEQPVNERAAGLLMDALSALGREAEALAVYERVRATLADDLGTDPGSGLRERHLRLLRAEGNHRASAENSTNLPTPLTAFIGRDDDLARVHALLDAGRLVTVVGPGGAGKTRLAVEAARGRAGSRDGVWIVDLAAVTDPGDVGAAMLGAMGLRGSALFESARTAVEAIGRRDGYRDGARPVDLPAATDSGDVAAPDLRGSAPFEPPHTRDDADVLAEHLTGRDVLLLVDNCEHLIDAVAHLLTPLLARCPGLRVLATSREPLSIDGEALVPLGPLALPAPDADPARARAAPSVRLFTARAAAVRPGFDVGADNVGDVLRVVRGLDGLPLALELAAARLRSLSLPDLAAGLSDRFRLLATGNRTAPPRHRTLRAVIAWSWDLLDADAREVAERISVLPGGVTPSSAAAVCADTAIPADEIPELLAALVDRSLLQLMPDTGRYRMLETIREYGLRTLAARDALTGVRDLAARHVAALAAEQDPLLRGPRQLDALAVLRAEYDNVLASLRHLCDVGDAEGAVALAADLTWFWQMLGRHRDATDRLGEALALPAGPPSARRDIAEGMLLLSTVATPSSLANDPVEGRGEELRALTARLLAGPEPLDFGRALTAVRLAFLDTFDASSAIIERVADGPDVWLAALARLFRAQAAENEGRLDRARSDVNAAVEGFDRSGDRWGVATALPLRSLLRQYDGDLDGARSDLDEAKRLAREFGPLGLGDETFIDLRLIDLHIRLGATARAIELIATTRERVLRSPEPEPAVLLDTREAGLRARTGDLDRARELLASAEAEMSARPAPGGEHGRALVAAVRGALCLESGDGDGAGKALARAYAAAADSGDMPLAATVAVTTAGLAAFAGEYRAAAGILGMAARLRGADDHTEPQVRALSERCRSALGDMAFADAYASGRELDTAEAVRRSDPTLTRRDPSPPHPA